MKNTLILLILLLAGCKTDETAKAIAPTSAPAQGTSVAPPAIPTELLLDVYENVDYIDIIFQNLPFSISQEDKTSIQQTIRYINNVAPTEFNANCPYFAQLIFQENGEIVLDGKIFFQEGCTFYLFYENGIATYSGSFTSEGIKFYNNILAQAEKVRSNG